MHVHNTPLPKQEKELGATTIKYTLSTICSELLNILQQVEVLKEVDRRIRTGGETIWRLNQGEEGGDVMMASFSFFHFLSNARSGGTCRDGGGEEQAFFGQQHIHK